MESTDVSASSEDPLFKLLFNSVFIHLLTTYFYVYLILPDGFVFTHYLAHAAEGIHSLDVFCIVSLHIA